MSILTGKDLAVEPWYTAEPARFARDRAAVSAIAPGLHWDPLMGDAGAWTGALPLWPFDRPEPLGLRTAVERGLVVSIEPRQAHPAVEPSVYPKDPEPSVGYRTMHNWHLRGDGSLCLLQLASDWTARESVADLAVMASGWYLEYLLMDDGIVRTMTLGGIASSRKYDAFLKRYVSRQLDPSS
jgi:hypothetical protein